MFFVGFGQRGALELSDKIMKYKALIEYIFSGANEQGKILKQQKVQKKLTWVLNCYFDMNYSGSVIDEAIIWAHENQANDVDPS